MIEKNFDISFIANLALREKQIQQNYRPIIAVHKWFARRPGTLFRGLLLSEFVKGDLREIFYQAHDLRGIKIADPFMGGGTPLIEANRVGCEVIGYDINQMAYWIVRQEIEHLDIKDYREAASHLQVWLERKVGSLYRTKCLKCGSPDAHVKYFIWVKTHECSYCGKIFDLFPNYLLSENRRHPKNVLICSDCGELNEVVDRKNPGICQKCKNIMRVKGPASRGQCECPHCENINYYPNSLKGEPRHRMIAIEYHCPVCKPSHKGRFFKKPDIEDYNRFDLASKLWGEMAAVFVPDEEIPPGDETDRLHRWGYRRYSEMFNKRQLLGLELSCQAIAANSDETIRNALATNLSDLLRYQNMLCRYDTMALKSLDIFSVHGFPVSLVQCESNLLGIPNGQKGSNIGSGGWSNIIDKYIRAKTYCENPFEVRHKNGHKIQIPIIGEWIGNRRHKEQKSIKEVELHCESSTISNIPTASLDAVFTDPPYFANVQYAELMDFCYVWLRRLVGKNNRIFNKPSTRNENELTGNNAMERGLIHFTDGLSQVFQNMARALKPGSPLVFTYHHNRIEAYFPIAVAILDSGLTCSDSIPCPAEMSASIHINGTGSSVIDTVFVCRSTGTIKRRKITLIPEEIAMLVREDLEHLRAGNIKPTRGDIRCIIYGHLVRLAIWNLRNGWMKDESVSEKIVAVSQSVERIGGFSGIEKYLSKDLLTVPHLQTASCETPETYGGEFNDEISF